MPNVQNRVPLISRDLCTDHYLSLYYNLRFMFENVKASERILNLPTMRELLTADVKFDVVLVELFSNDAFVGFAHKFNAPLISLTSSIPFPWHGDRTGSVDNPSYVTHVYSRFPLNRMGFSQRFVNAIYWSSSAKLAFAYFNSHMESAARRFFGGDLPPLRSIVTNTSLVLNGVRPNTPQVVEIGGVHVRPAKRLPEVSQ